MTPEKYHTASYTRITPLLRSSGLSLAVHHNGQVVQRLARACRYENIPDPESDISLPVVTITDFATGEAGKEVILLVGGEHARELITSEIVFWLGKLLAGKAACFRQA